MEARSQWCSKSQGKQRLPGNPQKLGQRPGIHSLSHHSEGTNTSAPGSGTSVLQSVSVVQATQFMVHLMVAQPTNSPIQECFTSSVWSPSVHFSPFRLVASFLGYLEQIMVPSMSKFPLCALPHLCPFWQCPWRVMEAHFHVLCAFWTSSPLPCSPWRVPTLWIVFLGLVWPLGSGQSWQFESTWWVCLFSFVSASHFLFSNYRALFSTDNKF